jgi:hypothetical protein
MNLDYLVICLYLAAVALVLAFILIIVLFRRLSFLSRRYREFMRGSGGLSLETMLSDLLKEQQRVEGLAADNREGLKGLAGILDTTIRGVGVVRFNAFQNTGSDLSFAVALLDARLNGVVLSSIYGREESRTYAKPVSAGRSPYQLSNEEQEAIRRAAESVRISP